MAPMICPACGVTLPRRVGRCPACHARLPKHPLVVGLAAILATLALVGIAIQVHSFWYAPRAELRVEIAPTTPRLSPDARGTDASTTLENLNKVTVVVTVLVRGLDISGKAVVEETLGPFRLRPGAVRDISVHFDTTPLESVDFEATAVNQADPDS